LSEWITLEYRKSTGWKISWKTCGKITDKMGIQHQKGPLVAAKYKMEETRTG
jgi:hypothetical protein